MHDESLIQSISREHETNPQFHNSSNLIGANCKLITPEMLTLVELDQQKIDAIVQRVSGGVTNVQDIYPLAPLQEGMLFHHLLNKQNDTYVLSTLFELQSHAQVKLLINALQTVINRHDVLRSAVMWEELPRPVQVVCRQTRLPVEGMTLDRNRDQIEQLKERMRPGHQRLDLREAPLMRLQVAADPHSTRRYAVLHVHHLVCDHQTLRLIVSEALTCLRGHGLALPSPVAFRNYVARALANASANDGEVFFRSKLGGIEEPTAPFGLFDVHGGAAEIKEGLQTLDPTLAKQVRIQARRLGVSAARVFHAAWGLVVARTSGRDDVVYGTVLFAPGQRSSHAQRMLGLSVNTLPLRLRLQDTTAKELVEQTHRELAELLNHQSVPLTLAQRCSGITGTAPLFTAILNYRHSVPDTEADSTRATGVRVLARGEAWTNYPITLTVDDLGDGFTMAAKTDRRIDPLRIIGYLHTALQSLSQALDEAPQTPALALSILPESERQQVIEAFNATRAAFPQEKLIHELFEEQARRQPEVVAVVHEEQALSYSELNNRANQLARYLRDKGVGPDLLVAVCVERSVEMLVGLLGILKAGGAYIPLDPTNPVDRLEHLMTDAAPCVLLTQERLRSALPRTAAEVIALDSDWEEIARKREENLDPRSLHLSPHHLAYVIYTSGSTGEPKGVMVEHRNIVNYAVHAFQQFDLASGNGSLICTSISFDLMLTGLYPTLLCGRTVRLCPEQKGLPALADEVLRSDNLAPLKLTPSHLALLERPLRSGLLSGRVRVLVIGGEPLQANAVQLWRKHAPGTRIFNHYGPTETTVGCVVNEVEGDCSDTVPIGRPISNTQIYILDTHRQTAPIGVAGEIYIGGAGVARGYLNRPKLTSERFLPDPFSADTKARMYKTGDLGRWRVDGVIEYLGRNDHQVKIRGYRIELGEIEAQLVRHETVKEAVVLAREDDPGEKRLVAYVTSQDASAAPSVEVLRTHLKAVLPEHMMPSAFVMLDHMPLTQNGKLDRRMLPAPGPGAYLSRQYEAPKGKVEEILAGIWQALLPVERVGRQDNFFELGGHSLLIMQMMESLRRVGLSAEIRRVFESPTLGDLANELSSEAVGQFEVPPNLIPDGCEAITPQMLTLIELEPEHIERIVQSVPGGAANIQDIYPLAPLQEGILFHHLLNDQGGDVYVVRTLLSIATRERLNELIAAMQQVIDRHDVLRTSILWEKLPRPVQVVYRRATLPVEEIALDFAGDPSEQIKQWMKPDRQWLDLRHAPLMRLQVAEDREGHCYALLQLHHIIDDATSLRIMISEVVAHLEGRSQQLLKSVPYRNHVAQALAYARKHDAEMFFRSKLGNIDEPTAPFGLLDVHGDGTQIEEARQEFEPGLAQRVRTQARRLGVSAATLFHAAWGLVIAHASGRDDVVFGSVLLGRLQGTAGAQQILGMFINTLPIRLHLQDTTAEKLVEQTQRELVELFNHEQASLAVAQKSSGIPASTPLFSALLNYRHSARIADTEWISADGIQVLASHGFTNYPITFSVDDLGEGFRLTAQTDRRINPDRITGYMRTAMQSLVEALEVAPKTQALALTVLPESERKLMIESFNATQSAYAQEKLIHHLFEEQVLRTPEAVAVIHERERLTYAELNGRANQLARYLIDKGVGPDQLVGICVERSLQMVVGLLGILKAGGAYVPLDPNYPVERLQYMLEDASPQVVLTQKELRAVLPCTKAEVIALDESSKEIAGYVDENLSATEPGLRATLLYVIYTSGSTGRPKGTVMPHRSMGNLIEWHRQNFRISEGQRVLQFAALSFDVAFQEIFSTLCTGGTLMLLDEWVRRDARALIELLGSQSIDRLFVPPLMLQSLAEFFKSMSAGLQDLKDVITAGEQLRISPEIVDFFKHLNGCRLHNHYGPTETHVVTALTLSGNPDEWPVLPTIGCPIANTQIYVLDTQQKPVPLEVAGEIYIGGANVARGYLNQRELTTERFLRDPFSSDPQSRLYRTGDLGRWRADGTIEYLGRNDNQVKIRGYRIELGEIEAHLAKHAQVGAAAVIARADVNGAKRLVAYITKRDQNAPTVEELRAHLKGVLPDYMVPSAFVVLEKLPLTPSGKLDRRALPTPDIGSYSSSKNEPPQGEVEETLAQVWKEVLQVEHVGRQDNFFELGGHSLLVLKALFKINELLGSTVSVKDVYRSPTLQELATRISGATFADDLVDLSREAALENEICARTGLSRDPSGAILLTGGTGFLGRFLLAQLLQDTDAPIYCLVRAPSQYEASCRLRGILAEWDLWRDDFEHRIVAIAGDLRRPRFGVDEVTYQILSQNIDSIYHCATSMNHLETYAMAKPSNVEAAKELLRLATSEKLKRINYISTFGVFSSATSDTSRVVDEHSPIDHEKHRSSRGYVASKWVGEKIFMTASERGIPCNIFRVGLVWADTQQGRYDELQRGYRILKSSLMSGYGIENYRYEMPPTPVDYVARSVVFLANQHRDGKTIFHISSSTQMMDGLFERYNEIAGARIELLPLYDWICVIKRLHLEGRSLPVVPLIDYAFSMDKESFNDHQRGIGYANVRFDCYRTHRELERAGIVAPVLNDDLLSVCVQSMLSRDEELREWANGNSSLVLPKNAHFAFSRGVRA